ncbi:DUF2283 domain-containing protein [Methanobrevibacter sp.]|uniref:DUF2283 domain-containing protein n=1 Tax=Methanobrevibacter sp. TaxID=66852 RepID=UPI00388F18C8
MKSKLNYLYDYEYDLIDITIDESSKYKKSIEITNGVILDLDENDFPAALEIISASKILDIEKQYLISPNIDLAIVSSEELICIEIKFTYLVSRQVQDICFKQNLANNYGIPEMETIFSTA